MSDMFDRLAKTVAGGVSRRDALRYLGGFLAGGFLAVLPGRARADRDDGDDDGDDVDEKAINKACQKYCSTCPKPTRGRDGDGDDDKGGRGVHGRCIHMCKRFLRKNPTAINNLCGACTATNPFTGCVTGATCCTPKGAAAFCTNTSSDAKNCGACGNVCPTATPDCCASKCVDTQTDANNCGSCGNKCASGKCSGGKCA